MRRALCRAGSKQRGAVCQKLTVPPEGEDEWKWNTKKRQAERSLLRGGYPRPTRGYPSKDAKRLIPELVCPCGCGIAQRDYCEHENCEEATLYLTFPCGAEGFLRMLDQGEWDFDVEPAESHKKPFRCN